MHHNELLGLDVGQKRTGIARASYVAKIAEPLMSVDTDCIVECLQKLIIDHDVDRLVIGLPRNLDGNDTAQTQWTRDWVVELKKHIQLPMYWQDEALTSRDAEIRLGSKNEGHDIDAHAAAAILEDYLGSSEDNWVSC
jgi:putative holliday junction resolvase